MSRSIFGLSLSPVLAWALVNPERFAAPCRSLPARKNPFWARVHGTDVRKGDLLALHASASEGDSMRMRSVVLRLREALDTTVPTEGAPYKALAGRVVAVATLAGSTSDAGCEPWCSLHLREALGVPGVWRVLLRDVLVLPRPVGALGGPGLWSLTGDQCVAVMDQVRALEARAARAA